MMCGEGPYCPYCQQAHREWRENPATFDIQEHGLRCKPSVTDQRDACASLAAHPICTCDGTPGRRCDRCMAKMGAADAVMEEVLMESFSEVKHDEELVGLRSDLELERAAEREMEP